MRAFGFIVPLLAQSAAESSGQLLPAGTPDTGGDAALLIDKGAAFRAIGEMRVERCSLPG